MERLPKAFRLSGPARTDRLFALGASLKAWPFKVFYLGADEVAASVPLPQVLFSIPKRQFKRAHDRNRIRRRCREVYRRHMRNLLLPAVAENGQDWHIAFIYTGGQTKVSAKELEKKLTSALKRLAGEIGSNAKSENQPLSPTPPSASGDWADKVG